MSLKVIRCVMYMTGSSSPKVVILSISIVMLMMASTMPLQNSQTGQEELENTFTEQYPSSLFQQQNGNGHDLSGELLTIDGLTDALVLEESALDMWKNFENLQDLENQSLSFNFYLHPSETIHFCWTQSNGSVYYASQSVEGVVSILHVDNTVAYGANNTPVRCAIQLTESNLPRIIYANGDDVRIARYATQSQVYWNLSHVWHKRTILEEAHPTGFEMVMSDLNTMWAVMTTESGELKQVNFSKAFWTVRTLDEGPVGHEIELMKDENSVIHLLYSRPDEGEIRLLRIDGFDSSLQVVSRDTSNLEFIGMGLDSNNIEQLATSSSTAEGYTIQLLRSLLGQRQGRLSPSPIDTITGVDDSQLTNVQLGDFNGDGFDDMVLSMPEATSGSNANAGVVHIYHGSVDGFYASPNATITGTSEDQMLGYASLVEDLNSDGLDDLFLSSIGGQGQVEIFYGTTDGVNQTSSFVLEGALNESFGSKIVFLDTINSLKFVAVSSKDAQTTVSNDVTLTGKVSVFKFEDNAITLQRNITQTGNGPKFGRTLETCDMNGDGFDELIVGNSPDLTSFNGYSSVEYFEGSSSGVDGTPQHILTSIVQGKLFAYSVVCLGDVNNDGYEDHIVTEPFNGTGAYNAGKLWLYHGHPTEYSAEPDWTYVSETINAQIGRQIVPIGDIDDDGYNDVLISKYSSGNSGRIEIFFGDGDGFESQSELFIQGQAGDHAGFLLAGNFDVNQDGQWEVAYGKLMTDGSGNDKVNVVVHSKREWEAISFPFTGTLQSVELGTSSRAETTILHQSHDGLSSSIHQLEHVGDGTSSGQWISQEIVSNANLNMSAIFSVTDSGRPILIVSENNSGLMYYTCEGTTALHKEILTTGTMGKYLGSTIDGDEEQHLAFTSGSGNQIFYTDENQGTWSSEMVTSSMVLTSPIQVHTSSSNQPFLVYRDSVNKNIEIATKSSSTWSFDSLLSMNEISSLHFSSVMLSNNTLVVAALVDDTTTTNLTVWDWTESTLVSSTLVELQDNNVIIKSGVTSNQTVYISTLTSGGTLSLHYRYPNEANWSTISIPQPPSSSSGYSFDMSTTNHLALSVRTTDEIHIYSMNTEQNWTHTSHSLSASSTGVWDFVVTPSHYVMLTTSSTNYLTWNSIAQNSSTSTTSSWNSMSFGLLQTESPTNAQLDSNETIHLSLWDELNDDVEVLRIYKDVDRDHVFDLIDEFPTLGNQWSDSDSDGFGDNQDGPMFDSCPTENGQSLFVIFGCSDFEADGFPDSIDACADQTGTSLIDRYGCTDSDQDGWSDNTFNHFFGDKFIDNWKQAIDSDGDGVGDNHGPDCCNTYYPWGEILSSKDPDVFPYLMTQWKDTDGDGFGDNDSDIVYGDYCPWDWGASWRDRNGCLDSDNDGASDPSLTGDIFEWNITHGADVWPTDPTQWADSDEDGYGDNDSQQATNPDHFPQTKAAANDSDDDGFPDDWTEFYTSNQTSDNSDGLILDDCPLVWGNSTRILFGCLDTDGDSWADSIDDLPFDPTQSTDSDGDGFGDNINGNLADQCLNEPGVLDGTQGVGCPIIDEDDDDLDGVINEQDTCPNTPSGEDVDSAGCGESQLDDDGDGVYNDRDICPSTTSTLGIDADGCTEEQRNVDTDGDGVRDFEDECSDTPTGESVDSSGCGESQKDSDGDGILDSLDACDDTPEGYPILPDGCTDEFTLNQGDFDEDGYAGDYTYDIDAETGLHTNQSGDAFKADPTQWFDSDGDGYGDNPAPANRPDACPFVSGNSSNDRFGCIDSDGDGYSDANGTWATIHGADAFALDPTQWVDVDGDGFGDNVDGNNPDLCPNTGISYLNQVDENGCAPNQIDSDNDGILDSMDSCPNQPKGSDGFDDGCPRVNEQTEEEDTLLFGFTPVALGGIVGGIIAAIVLALVVLRFVLREDDDDDYDDYYDDDDDNDDEDIFSQLDKKKSSSQRGSSRSSSSSAASTMATSPKSRGPSGGPTGGPTSGPPKGPSRGSSGPSGGPPSAKGPGSGPSRGPTRSEEPHQSPTPQPAKRVAKKRAASEITNEPKAKVRKAKIDVDLDVFESGQDADRNAAVDWIVGAIADGVAERTMLLQLQETGWTAEQSRAIINLAKNQS